MSNIALELIRTTSGSVNPTDAVVFDTVLYLSGNISYNDTTGTITFQENGRYIVNWWVTVQTSLSIGGITFALSSDSGDCIRGSSSGKSGQVNGFGIILVDSLPDSTTEVNLENAGTSIAFYGSGLMVTASLLIVQDDIVSP